MAPLCGPEKDDAPIIEFVKANSGHSSAMGLNTLNVLPSVTEEVIEFAPALYHDTSRDNALKIMRSGLIAMWRASMFSLFPSWDPFGRGEKAQKYGGPDGVTLQFHAREVHEAVGPALCIDVHRNALVCAKTVPPQTVVTISMSLDYDPIPGAKGRNCVFYHRAFTQQVAVPVGVMARQGGLEIVGTLVGTRRESEIMQSANELRNVDVWFCPACHFPNQFGYLICQHCLSIILFRLCHNNALAVIAFDYLVPEALTPRAIRVNPGETMSFKDAAHRLIHGTTGLHSADHIVNDAARSVLQGLFMWWFTYSRDQKIEWARKGYHPLFVGAGRPPLYFKIGNWANRLDDWSRWPSVADLPQGDGIMQGNFDDPDCTFGFTEMQIDLMTFVANWAERNRYHLRYDTVSALDAWSWMQRAPEYVAWREYWIGSGPLGSRSWDHRVMCSLVQQWSVLNNNTKTRLPQGGRDQFHRQSQITQEALARLARDVRQASFERRRLADKPWRLSGPFLETTNMPVRNCLVCQGECTDELVHFIGIRRYHERFAKLSRNQQSVGPKPDACVDCQRVLDYFENQMKCENCSANPLCYECFQKPHCEPTFDHRYGLPFDPNKGKGKGKWKGYLPSSGGPVASLAVSPWDDMHGEADAAPRARPPAARDVRLTSVSRDPPPAVDRDRPRFRYDQPHPAQPLPPPQPPTRAWGAQPLPPPWQDPSWDAPPRASEFRSYNPQDRDAEERDGWDGWYDAPAREPDTSTSTPRSTRSTPYSGRSRRY